MRLLLVEDDEILAQTLSNALAEQSYVVDLAQDGEEGWDYALSFTYDLILLDVSLPKLDGISLCRKLRNEHFNNPILLLTAKDRSEDKVSGLDAGADDYVVKPCTIPELLARIRALLRRKGESGSPILEWGNLCLDPSTCEARWQDQLLSLSPKEYNLLELLLRNPKRVFSKGAILEHIWSFDDPPSEDTIRAHIKGLRRKLKAVGAQGLVETVYGMGYRLKALPPQEVKTPPQDNSTDPPETEEKQKTQKQQKTLAAVAKMWDQFRDPLLKRLDPVNEAIASLQKKRLTPDQREAAEKNAHKLTGSLGMFGLNEGSEWARNLENWFRDFSQKEQKTISPQELSQLQNWSQQLHQLIENPPTEQKNSETDQPTTSFQHPSPPLVSLETPPKVLIVANHLDLLSELQQEAAAWKVELQQVNSLVEGEKAIAEHPPDLILLECIPPDGLVSLQTLTTQYPQLSVLLVSEKPSFSDRIAITRLGGRVLFSYPLDPNTTLRTLCLYFQRQHPPQFRLLAVDDDPLILERLETFLSPWSIDFQPLADPRFFWETLEEKRPNLLILDVEMPYINGIELCQVVRSDPQWQQLPVLFLSANRDRETIHRIYQVGGDDYIAKPVTEPELMTRILNRMERQQMMLTVGC